MKPQLFLFFIMLFFAINGCTKPGIGGGCDPGNMNGNMSLIGKWQLVHDSTSNSMVKVVPAITNYVGEAGDYFDFRGDGYCYTREGNVYDTLSYQQLSSQSVVIQNFGLVVNGTTETSMLMVTANAATITTQNILSPGGTIFREVNLKR